MSRKAIRQAAAKALEGIKFDGAKVPVDSNELGLAPTAKGGLPRLQVRVLADTVADVDQPLARRGTPVDASVSITAVMKGDHTADDMEGVLADAHDALMADRTLGGVASALDYSDFSMEEEEGLVAGTTNYVARYRL